MTIIKEGDSGTKKAWGRQTPRNVVYRKFRYVIETACGDDLLLHNTVTGEIVQIGGEERTAWEQLPCQPTESLAELLSRHYLVPEATDDAKAVNNLRTLLKKLSRRRAITDYTILPTTGCNARCFYCYENDYPHLPMTKETAEQLVQYICQHCGKERSVKLNWFGGEPMLGRNIIDFICTRLREEGIAYTSKMVSNGYLFTPELAKTAKMDWNLKKIQITLDGTEDVYNKTKAYVGVTGSPYRRVLANIRLLLSEGICVTVRMNLGQHNAEDLERLIEELAAAFASFDNFSCYVHELFDSDGFTPVTHSVEEWSALKNQRAALLSRIAALGLASPKTSEKTASLRTFYCMADAPSAVTVNPLGGLGRCEHFAYAHLIGDLAEGIIDKAEEGYWLNASYQDKCSLCVLYPECGILRVCETERVCSLEQVQYKVDRNRRIALRLAEAVKNAM